MQPPSVMINWKRSLEQNIINRMIADGWQELPQNGQPMHIEFQKVFRYMDWIRKQAGLIKEPPREQGIEL